MRPMPTARVLVETPTAGAAALLAPAGFRTRRHPARIGLVVR